MVRTSGGIRISAGKSSNKGGGATGGGSRSTPSTPSAKSSSKGSNRLPPIPHCEAPSWQKPITNFFNSDAGPSKTKDVEPDQYHKKEGCSSHEEVDEGSTIDATEETSNPVTEKHVNNESNGEAEQVPEKRRRTEISNEDKDAGKDINAEVNKKTEDQTGKTSVCDKNRISKEEEIEKTTNSEENGKENIDTNILNS